MVHSTFHLSVLETMAMIELTKKWYKTSILYEDQTQVFNARFLTSFELMSSSSVLKTERYRTARAGVSPLSGLFCGCVAFRRWQYQIMYFIVLQSSPWDIESFYSSHLLLECGETDNFASWEKSSPGFLGTSHSRENAAKVPSIPPRNPLCTYLAPVTTMIVCNFDCSSHLYSL